MNRHPPVMLVVAGASLPVRMVCFERGLSATTPLLVGEQALCRGVLQRHRRPGSGRRARAQGKIKGRGTYARRKPCLHVGKGGTQRKWQRAASGAKSKLVLGLACALFAGLYPSSPGGAS